MAMATLERRGGAHEERLGELQAWYVARLRPKLADAASAGAIAPAAAAALESQMQGLLDLRAGAARHPQGRGPSGGVSRRAGAASRRRDLRPHGRPAPASPGPAG